MGFFFLPAVATVLENFGILKPVVWKLLLICFISAGLTFGAAYGTVRLCRKLLRQED
jgi:putative effector of murein hydrolase LrgA (UPF0299 family)